MSISEPHKALHIIFEKTINQQKKIENIKAVEIREGTEQQYLDSTVLKVSNATSNVTKLWNDISNKTTTDFPSYNLTVAVSPYKDPLLGLQLHLYIRQSNNVNATGPLRKNCLKTTIIILDFQIALQFLILYIVKKKSLCLCKISSKCTCNKRISSVLQTI